MRNLLALPLRRDGVGLFWIPLAIVLAFGFQAGLFRDATSATFDEGTYLKLARAATRHGDFAPFVHLGVAPLPVLAAYALPARQAADPDRVDPAEFPAQIRTARIVSTLCFGLPLVLGVYAWLARRRGIAAGAAGAALVAFSPTVLAHGAVAGTDAALALGTLAALAALARYAAAPTRRTYAIAAAAVGLAFSAKYSAAFLLMPAFVVLAGTAAARDASPPGAARRFRIARRAARGTAGLALAALGIAWALHGFRTVPVLLPAEAHPQFARVFGEGPFASSLAGTLQHVPAPAPLKGFFTQIFRAGGGHDAYLLGRTSEHGWWYYHPAAFLFKSTPVELLVAAAAAWAAVRGRRRGDATARLWALAALVYGLLMLGALNLGQRYLLPLYPLFVLLAVDGLWAAAAERPRLRAAAAGGAAALQIAAALAVAPHYLSYFNPLAGGPAEGHRVLVDSNLDWGQDLPPLRREAERLGGGPVALAYFGTAPPEAYVPAAVDWTDPDAARLAGCRWLAVSATLLKGLYVSGDPFGPLRGLPPAGRGGWSIFVYDLRRPEVAAALAEARRRGGIGSAPAGGGDRPRSSTP